MIKQDVLYHYTCVEHLSKILESKHLKLTQSNLKPPKDMSFMEMFGTGDKPVVWLTDSDSIEGHGLEGSVYDKTAVKITVLKKPHMKYWRTWSKQNHINKEWAKQLVKGRRDSTWFVSEEIIPLTDIIKIENRLDGTIYYKQ